MARQTVAWHVITTKRCVLAYSGGLDTSVAIHWLREEKGLDVITLTANTA
jgi:argininosuccinate synthase